MWLALSQKLIHPKSFVVRVGPSILSVSPHLNEHASLPPPFPMEKPSRTTDSFELAKLLRPSLESFCLPE